MARIHGRGSLLYLQGSGANAIPFSNAADWDINITFPTEDVSAIGDDWQTFIRGMLGFTGTFSGPYESSSTQAWDAMTATSARAFYLYPDKSAMTQYYYGTAWIDLDVKGGTKSPVTFSSKVTGTGTLAKNP
jgi:hypothetical protein